MGQSTNNSPASTNILEKWFHLSEQGTTIKRELLAGLTTFVSMAYILFVNPSVLGMAGMNKGAVFTATALSAIIGCLLMAFLANYPIAIAPGLGDNGDLMADRDGWCLCSIGNLYDPFFDEGA